MPTLREQADKLTNPSLVSGIIETIIARGARELMAVLPFKSFQGSSYDFVNETEIGEGNSAQDPYGENIPNAGGKNTRYVVPATMLIRNADTAKIDVTGKSDINDQREDDILKQAKKIARDFLFQFVAGRVDTTGDEVESYVLRGLEHWIAKFVQAGFEDMLVDAGGSSLALTHFNDLSTRWKGERYDAFYMDRETGVAFRDLLTASPGNTAEMIMNEAFGMPMLHYDGIPCVITDAVGRERHFTEATVDGSEVTVTDPDFVGFSETDAGNTINGTEITDVVSSHTVGVADGAAVNETGPNKVDKSHAIYAIRFDEVDGACAVYHENRGMQANAGEYHGPIAGFDAEDLGILDWAPRYRTRLDFFGNTAVQSPHCLAKLDGYEL